jgi:transposase
MFGGHDDDTTKLQDCILEQYDLVGTNTKQIAANCDCSESYVKQTLNEYREGWNDDSGFGIL